MIRRVIWYSIIILSTLVGLAVIWQLRLGVVLFLFSLTVAAAVRPVMAFWQRRRLPKGPAILLTYLPGIGLLAGAVIFAGPLLFNEIASLTNRMALSYEIITETWPQGTTFQQAVAAELPEPQELYQAIAGEQGDALLQNVLGVAANVFGPVSMLAMVVIISIYWSADQRRFERLWLSLVPADQRNRARQGWWTLETEIGDYIRSELLQSLLAGGLLALGYWLMGLEYPLLLALLGALLWFIPWLGAVLAVVFPFLVGLEVSAFLAVGAAVYTLAVLLMLEVLVEPRFFGRRRYSSLLIVLMVVVLADAFGLVGVVIAPPLAAAVQILFNALIRAPSTAPTADPKERILNIRSRLAVLQEQIAASGAPASPEVLSLMERLENLVEQTREYFGLEEDEPSLGLPQASDARTVGPG